MCSNQWEQTRCLLFVTNRERKQTDQWCVISGVLYALQFPTFFAMWLLCFWFYTIVTWKSFWDRFCCCWYVVVAVLLVVTFVWRLLEYLLLQSGQLTRGRCQFFRTGCVCNRRHLSLLKNVMRITWMFNLSPAWKILICCQITVEFTVVITMKSL